MSRWRQNLLAAGTLLALAGCIPSNVVARDDRIVGTRIADLAFAPAPELRLEGLFESVEIAGDAAVSLRKVYYLFEADGRYTAAALVEASDGPCFQTLAGTWRATAEGLVLDDGAPVPCETAVDHVRLTTPDGVLVLRRGVLQ